MALFSKRPPITPATTSLGGALHPILVGTEWRETLSLAITDPDQLPIYTPIGTDWGIAYAVDLGDSYSYVTKPVADEAGLDEDALRSIATSTLAEIASEHLVLTGDDRYRVELPGLDDLAASLILVLPSILPQLELDGDPVIAIGHRVMLHVCGSNDAAGIEGMRGLALALFESGDAKPVTPELQTITADGAIVPFGG
jgi:uncharacterized protein YtpQ (UPF0354 family)